MRCSLKVTFASTITLFASLAMAADWAKVFDGNGASFAIISAAIDPQMKIPLLIVEVNLNHMNERSQDGTKTVRSMRSLYLVNCDNRRYQLYKWAVYEADRQKGNIIEKEELAGLIDSTWKHAESESAEEYWIGKVCQVPKL